MPTLPSFLNVVFNVHRNRFIRDGMSCVCVCVLGGGGVGGGGVWR